MSFRSLDQREDSHYINDMEYSFIFTTSNEAKISLQLCHTTTFNSISNLVAFDPSILQDVYIIDACYFIDSTLTLLSSLHAWSNHICTAIKLFECIHHKIKT